MSLFQNLELGLWNGWILMLYFPLHPLIMIIIDKVIGNGDMTKKMGDIPFEKGERRMFVISMVIIFLMFIYSIFLPLKVGTLWFYIGFPIFLIGFISLLIAIANISTTQLGKPFTKGMYRYSRHPMIVSELITFLGTGVATASWIFLLLTFVLIALEAKLVLAEERGCIETFGDEYRNFMDLVPRWIGRPKSKV